MGVQRTHTDGHQGSLVDDPGHSHLKAADGGAELDKTFRFGPVKIKLVPLFTSVKIFTGLIMSIFLLQFIYSSVRKRTQECENIDERNPQLYTICPKGRT